MLHFKGVCCDFDSAGTMYYLYFCLRIIKTVVVLIDFRETFLLPYTETGFSEEVAVKGTNCLEKDI